MSAIQNPACVCDTPVITSCCPGGIPSTLTVELSGTTCADFVTTVAWVAGNSRWEGFTTVCGELIGLYIQCDQSFSQGFIVDGFYAVDPGQTFLMAITTTYDCDPLLASVPSAPIYPYYGVATCCSGGYSNGALTITE